METSGAEEVQNSSNVAGKPLRKKYPSQELKSRLEESFIQTSTVQVKNDPVQSVSVGHILFLTGSVR